jgi:hypothetical protein
LWSLEDCRHYAPPSLLTPDDRRIKPCVPMAVPHAWLILRILLKTPYKQTERATGVEKLVTHIEKGVRVQVETEGKHPKTYERLFNQHPQNQTVLYLVPSQRIRKKIQGVAQNFPHVSVPDLEWEDKPHPKLRSIKRAEFHRFISHTCQTKRPPFPLNVNLFMAAQDCVFDLYRAPSVTLPTNGPTEGEGK